MLNYSDLVLESLFKNDVIDEELYNKCKKPQYIQDLPHDLRTNELDELKERKEQILLKINETNKEVSEFVDIFKGMKEDIPDVKDEIDTNLADYEEANEEANGRYNKIMKSLEKIDKRLDKYDDNVSHLTNLDKIYSDSVMLTNYLSNMKNLYHEIEDIYMDNVMDTQNLTKLDDFLANGEEFFEDYGKETGDVAFLKTVRKYNDFNDELSAVNDKIKENS